MRPRIIAPLVGLAVLSACTPTLEAGTVTGRDHQKAYTWVQQVCSAYNSKGICTVYTPMVHQEPERWTLRLTEGGTDGRVDVDEHAYEHCADGDRYPDCATR